VGLSFSRSLITLIAPPSIFLDGVLPRRIVLTADPPGCCAASLPALGTFELERQKLPARIKVIAPPRLAVVSTRYAVPKSRPRRRRAKNSTTKLRKSPPPCARLHAVAAHYINTRPRTMSRAVYRIPR